MSQMTQRVGPVQISVPSHYSGTVVIEDTMFLPSGPNQVAVECEWPRADSIVAPTLLMRNCTITPGFINGVWIHNGWHACFQNVNIYGAYDNLTLGNGFIIDGESMAVTIDACQVYHAITGVLVVGSAEGTTISNSSFAGVVHGVWAQPSSGGQEPWLNIADTHIAASRVGIMAQDRNGVSVHHSLIYRHDRYGDPNWDGIILRGATEDVALDHVWINADPANTGRTGNYWAVRNETVHGLLSQRIFARGCSERGA